MGRDIRKRYSWRPHGSALPSNGGKLEGELDAPKRDMTKIITVAPARWSASDCLEAMESVESMAVNAGEGRGLTAVIWKGGCGMSRR